MAEIKTAEQRIHKLEGGEGDSFVTIEQALIAERDELRAALAERDAELAALEKQEPVAWLVYGNGSHRYSTLTFDVSQVPDIYVGGDVVALYAAAGAAPEPTKTVDRAWSRFCGCIGRGPDAPYPGMIEAFESHYGQNFTDKDWRNETGIWAAAWGYATRQAGAAPVPEGWRSAVAMAYGHLWHVNNEPMAPIPLRSEESASYAARKLLRDLMTTKERGEAINAVQKLLAAAPKEPT